MQKNKKKKPLRVIQVHNQYQEPGGEDQVFAAESDLLTSHGHEVLQYSVHNDSVFSQGKFALAVKTVWNHARYKELRKIFIKKRPNVVHVHNTLPLISPAIYYAAKASKTPICLTLHNYRLLCPNALFFRNDVVCEDCMSRFIAWPGVRHSCYRGSRPATMVVFLVNFLHRIVGTWKHIVDAYIALSEFSKQKFIKAGFPKNKIVVKPNFVVSGSYVYDTELAKKRDGALFVGRLSREKGVETLLKAYKIVGKSMSLKIVGDGPLAPVVQKTVSDKYGISWLGQRPIQEVYELMAKAEILIFPSEWYEGMPRTIIEAFAHGTPVISSELGAMAEMIDHGRNGLHFKPGSVRDLADRVIWANEHPDEVARMGRNARAEYEDKYTPEKNYNMLMNIYEQTIDKHTKRQC